MKTTGPGSHNNTLEPATRAPSQPFPQVIRAPVSASGAAGSPLGIPQYGLPAILGVWSAAALPMAALAWLIAPALADRLSGAGNLPLAKSLMVCLTLGLVWQFLLVLLLVGREQRTLRWSTLRGALWLGPPRSPGTGRVGGRVWLVLVPLVLLFALKDLLLPSLPAPGDRDLGAFLESDTGQTFLSGNWAWYGLMIVLWIFNTVLGEELLFRGFLLPRMNGVFGRGDWVANGVLFAAYHLHVPWSIPVNLLDTFLLAYPAKRYGSAWVGIAVHSAQSLFFATVVLGLVLS
jgi:membrane protease YdiL (CAAX protease family)